MTLLIRHRSLLGFIIINFLLLTSIKEGMSAQSGEEDDGGVDEVGNHPFLLQNQQQHFRVLAIEVR